MASNAMLANIAMALIAGLSVACIVKVYRSD